LWISPEQLRKIAPWLNLGVVLTACVLMGVGLGYWLDAKLGTKPWLLLAGSLLGMAAGFYHFIKAVIHLQKKSDGENPGDHQP